jgi:antitoxin component of RelBE/YafQ-DinJ toxin-antitoxin module
MKDTNLIIRIDEELKNDFKKIVDKLEAHTL